MRSNWHPAARLGLTALLVLAVLAGSEALAYRAFAPAGPTTVATVDLQTVYGQLNIRAAADAALLKTAQDLQAQVDAKRKALEALNADLSAYQPGSAQFKEAEKKTLTAATEVKALRAYAEQKLEREKSRVLRDIYVQIKKSIGQYAKAHKIDLVLLDDTVAKIEETTEKQTLQQISALRILYRDDLLDITDDVIAFMNGPGGPATAPATAGSTPGSHSGTTTAPAPH